MSDLSRNSEYIPMNQGSRACPWASRIYLAHRVRRHKAAIMTRIPTGSMKPHLMDFVIETGSMPSTPDGSKAHTIPITGMAIATTARIVPMIVRVLRKRNSAAVLQLIK